jgi:hypothetical protein
MDECKKVFDFVYKVLMEHQLINIVEGVEKKKHDAYVICIPMLKQFIEHNDTDMRQWLSQLLKLLNIPANDKNTLNDIFGMILLQIQNLKDQLAHQESRIQMLELNLQMQDTNMKAFDIGKLFRFYFLDDIIKTLYPDMTTWSKFTSK